MTYKATLCKLTNLKKHPNADRLMVANALGYFVITGLDADEDTLGVVFPSDGKLSHQMCMENNLYRKDPVTGEEMGGYFDEKGRVKSIKLRGSKSECFWTPLTSLSWAGNITILEGAYEQATKNGELYQLDEFNGHRICEKYFTPKTANLMRQGKQNPKKKTLQDYVPDFKRHSSTTKLREVVDFLVGQNDEFIVTEKLHGCVSEDTIVDTLEFGKVTIGKVVDNRLNVNIKSYDTELEEIVYVPVDDYYFLENNGEWYELELDNGTILKITGNNPVWLPELQIYRRVEDLSIGDILLTD